MPPRSVASFAHFSYLLSKGEMWEGNIEGSALWVQYLPPFTTFWPTSLPSPNGWILSSMTDTVETGDSLLLFSCFTTSLPTPSSIFPQEMKMYWFYCLAPRTCLRSHLPGASSWCLGGLQDWQSFLVSLLLHTVQKLSSQSIHFFSLPLPRYNGMLSGPDFSLVLSRPKVTSSGLHQDLDSGWKTEAPLSRWAWITYFNSASTRTLSPVWS